MLLTQSLNLISASKKKKRRFRITDGVKYVTMDSDVLT
jgi:hypothetical protein